MNISRGYRNAGSSFDGRAFMSANSGIYNALSCIMLYMILNASSSVQLIVNVPVNWYPIVASPYFPDKLLDLFMCLAHHDESA